MPLRPKGDNVFAIQPWHLLILLLAIVFVGAVIVAVVMAGRNR